MVFRLRISDSGPEATPADLVALGVAPENYKQSISGGLYTLAGGNQDRDDWVLVSAPSDPLGAIVALERPQAAAPTGYTWRVWAMLNIALLWSINAEAPNQAGGVGLEIQDGASPFEIMSSTKAGQCYFAGVNTLITEAAFAQSVGVHAARALDPLPATKVRVRAVWGSRNAVQSVSDEEGENGGWSLTAGWKLMRDVNPV